MPEFLNYEFFRQALVAGALIGIITSNLGVFVVLRKMSFFSEAISHASLTGIAMGLLLGVDPLWGAVAFSLFVALSVASIGKRRDVSMDTVIGVAFSTAMALGVVVIGQLKGYRVDLFGYLFGDILGVAKNELVLIALLTIAGLAALFTFFRSWAKIAFHADLARVEEINVDLHDKIFISLLALVLALGIKLVGAILIGPLIIIPAAAAKNISGNLRGMFLISTAIGLLATLGGLVASYYANLASGPTVVLGAAAIYGLSLFAKIKPIRF